MSEQPLLHRSAFTLPTPIDNRRFTEGKKKNHIFSIYHTIRDDRSTPPQPPSVRYVLIPVNSKNSFAFVYYFLFYSFITRIVWRLDMFIPI